MTTLHLVRHGETTSNVLQRLDTALPGAGLTDFGARQAVRYALERPDAETPILISSAARRAQQTAELIGSVWGVPNDVRDGLFEVQVGDLEDQTSEDAHKVFGATVRSWFSGDTAARIPGGESLDDVYARYLPVIDAIAEEYLSGPNAREVHLVSHGAAIRLVAAHLVGMPAEFALAHHLKNTGSIELTRTPDGWTCERWGQELPPFHTDDEPEFARDPMG
ncbi:histidine phosphatase family protein [Williamsia sp. 1138]|uniref:Histidine phosphatase family protein n=1 Tax=Gordonia rubripertincta TaxID=36822 RepID=A0ABT4MQX1_GORRU|nr:MULTISPECIES: histidine phosphatase family protein [Mycobacteriales]MCZ4549402.1 histidine phosphatase family protein [Gordonia rubripertincta]OZG28959.1 histidine phosphatase family protein [Williamsia sp. 1138]